MLARRSDVLLLDVDLAGGAPFVQVSHICASIFPCVLSYRAVVLDVEERAEVHLGALRFGQSSVLDLLVAKELEDRYVEPGISESPCVLVTGQAIISAVFSVFCQVC